MNGALRPRPLVVGILNATPDSFYDGGKHADLIARAHTLVDQGADWLDIGGESTRPGASTVDADEECRRILPIIEALRDVVPLSVDTTKPAVARRALAAGACIVNDVRGLGDPEMVAVTADAWATIVMHSRGTPQTMGTLCEYEDVVTEVRDWLCERAGRARSDSVWIDPGIGFAKTADQSLALLRNTSALVATGWPVLIGASRKSFIGQILDLQNAEDRLPGSLAAAAVGWSGGAQAFRVHDVRATREALDLLYAVDATPDPMPDRVL